MKKTEVREAANGTGRPSVVPASGSVLAGGTSPHPLASEAIAAATTAAAPASPATPERTPVSEAVTIAAPVSEAATAAAPTSDAPTLSRAELIAWLRELLPDPYAFPEAVGASYGPAIRELEYVSRPLWALFSLMASGEFDEDLVAPFVQRIREGLRSGERAFPEASTKTRQVVVEMGVYGFGLLACRERFLRLLAPEERERLGEWLYAANDVELPWGNWYVFRVMVNCGLRVAGLPHDAERLRQDARAIESMYAGGGWYEDGMPFQRDYYTIFTFHFAALLLSRFAPELAEDLPFVRAAEHRWRKFSADFLYWFDEQGRSLPFGRSVSYRFGHAAPWAASAVARMSGALEPGEVKALLMANLTWWHGRPIMSDGRLSVGYGYPNQLLGEDYTGPGAPGWAFKSFVVLALSEEDGFWAEPARTPAREARHRSDGCGMLFTSSPLQTCVYSAMQYNAGSVRQRMSKYGKLCYSTAFGWNASVIAERVSGFAVDSALVLGIAGTDQFAGRTRIEAYELTDAYAYSMWSTGEVARVETWLVPVDACRHLRVHHVEAAYQLASHEGAFPVAGWSRKFDRPRQTSGEVTLERAGSDGRVRRSSITDASALGEGLAELLEAAGLGQLAEEEWLQRTPEVVPQDPNTNIYDWEPSAVPALSARLAPGTSWLACLVEGNPDVQA